MDPPCTSTLRAHILGARTIEQRHDNLGCLHVALTDDHLARFDNVSKIVRGWPHDFLAGENIQNLMFAYSQNKIR